MFLYQFQLKIMKKASQWVVVLKFQVIKDAKAAEDRCFIFAESDNIFHPVFSTLIFNKSKKSEY